MELFLPPTDVAEAGAVEIPIRWVSTDMRQAQRLACGTCSRVLQAVVIINYIPKLPIPLS